MANQITLGDILSFEVTYDRPDLAFVAAKVYSYSSGSFHLVTTMPMSIMDVNTNTYGCIYAPPMVGTYIVTKGSYTDGTYSTSDGRPSGSEGFTAVISGTETVIVNTPDLVGLIDNTTLVAFLED